MYSQKIRRTMLLFSFLLFPVILNYISPVLMVMGASKGIAASGLFFWCTFFLVSFFLGRAACAYICPLHAIQMIKYKVTDNPLKKIKYLKIVKYILWLAWIGVFFYFVSSSGGLKKINFFFLTEKFISVDGIMGLAIYYALIGLPLLIAFVFGKMGFCYYFCPLGVLSIIGTKLKNLLRLPSLRIEADKSKCRNCGSCDEACPMSLEVSHNVQAGCLNNTDCLLCGECCTACTSGVLKRKFSKGGR